MNYKAHKYFPFSQTIQNLLKSHLTLFQITFFSYSCVIRFSGKTSPDNQVQKLSFLPIIDYWKFFFLYPIYPGLQIICIF